MLQRRLPSNFSSVLGEYISAVSARCSRGPRRPGEAHPSMPWAQGSYPTISFLRAMALILVVLPHPLLYNIIYLALPLVFLSQPLAKAFHS